MRKAALLAILAAPWGCSSPSPAPSEPWEMQGSRVIGCCCSAPCPCRINKKPQHCHGCDASTAVHIDRGHIGPVRMDGVTYVMVGKSFAEDPSKNWAHLYVADTMTDAQFEALKGMFEEEMKGFGPKAKHLVGTFTGVHKVPISYRRSDDGREFTVSIPAVYEIRARTIVLPGHKEPVVSTGIFDDFGDRLVHAEPLVHKYSDSKVGYSFDLSGRQANIVEFTLSASRAEKGGIGWGCYSGHAELGSKEKYAEQVGGDDPK